MKGKIRSSRGDWPDLDHALFEWQQRMEQKKAIITGEILKTKARELWAALPQFDDIEEPKWSNGWLEGFKKRLKSRSMCNMEKLVLLQSTILTISHKWKNYDAFAHSTSYETFLIWTKPA
jgi:hypothetical protein